jgi:hypothetical protein
LRIARPGFVVSGGNAMPKFSGSSTVARTQPSSPIRDSGVPMQTHEGGAGVARDAKSELFLLAVTNMVAEDTFYESATVRDSRFRDLVHQVTREDPSWVARFVPFLRNDMLMRSASVVMAAEFALARKGTENPVFPSVREVVASALQRADEPAEFIGYWKARTGRRTLPGGVQRGIADAVARLYNEYAALKYDGGTRGIRMGDVIEMSHPTAVAPWQDDLFRYLLDRRHNPQDIRVELGQLPMITNWRELQAVPAESRRAFLRSPQREQFAERLKLAGMTWEDFSGWITGGMDAEAWEAIAPTMPYMATLRNLRNFEQAGLAPATLNAIVAKLTDPEAVKRSKQFPFRFLSAYKAVSSLKLQAACEEALDLSLSNVPALRGRSLILVDCSGSMFPGMSRSDKSGLHRYELAALFGTALWKRAVTAGEHADLVAFGTGSQVMSFPKGQSLLPAIGKFPQMGGTYTAEAVQRHFAGHDRVIILTDEQAADGQVDRVVPATTPLYTFNLAGYRAGHGISGTAGRHTFGGLSDKAFIMLALLERGQSADWPF